MASKFRGASVYWNGKRIAHAVSGSFTPALAAEDIVTEDGFQGVSAGAKTCDVQIERATPVAGDGMTLHVGDEGTVTVAPINGQVVTIKPAVVMEAPSNWDHKQGTMTGTLRFHGGEPKYTG